MQNRTDLGAIAEYKRAMWRYHLRYFLFVSPVLLVASFFLVACERLVPALRSIDAFLMIALYCGIFKIADVRLGPEPRHPDASLRGPVILTGAQLAELVDARYESHVSDSVGKRFARGRLGLVSIATSRPVAASLDAREAEFLLAVLMEKRGDNFNLVGGLAAVGLWAALCFLTHTRELLVFFLIAIAIGVMVGYFERLYANDRRALRVTRNPEAAISCLEKLYTGAPSKFEGHEIERRIARLRRAARLAAP